MSDACLPGIMTATMVNFYLGSIWLMHSNRYPKD